MRDWFKAQCEALGCTVAVDEVGNMFARRPGRNNELPPIAMGSHLDTQPTGGKFDGVLGVLGALEAMRTLARAGYETNAPIEIVNWTNEEGSRFAPGDAGLRRVCRRLHAATTPMRAPIATARLSATSSSASAIAATSKAGARKFGAMFELHIEQGPILEDERQDDRRRHRRAGHALVRGHGDRPGGAHRRDADACCARTRCSAPRA